MLSAAACLRETEDVNRAKEPGYELFIKGALLRFLALLIAQGKNAAADGDRRLPAIEKDFAMGGGPLWRRGRVSPMQHSWCLAARAILCGGSGR